MEEIIRAMALAVGLPVGFSFLLAAYRMWRVSDADWEEAGRMTKKILLFNRRKKAWEVKEVITEEGIDIRLGEIKLQRGNI